MNADDDFTDLKKLLKSWSVGQLFQLFRDEDINIEEMYMMKSHHVAELLKKYKMGVRIRFEHNFEKWRYAANRPIELITVNNIAEHRNCTVNNNVNKKVQVIDVATNTNKRYYRTTATSTNTMREDTNKERRTPSPINENQHRDVTNVNNKKRSLRSLTQQNTNATMASTEALDEETPSPMPTMERLQSISQQNFLQKLTENSHVMNLIENFVDDGNSLLHILHGSGSKGASILSYYDKHDELTPMHRSLLIQVIVNFFDDHDFHLSLQTSHKLERQILDLFPTEKLENFRTEKRGKIYVKFCNMKRYRRDKPGAAAKRKWEDSTKEVEDVATQRRLETTIDCNAEMRSEDVSIGFDNWIVDHLPTDMHIKAESFSDDEY